MRATIKAAQENLILLTADVDGERRVRSFWAPMSGGYVRQVDVDHPGTLGWQVCEKLAGSGSTLHWDGKRPLIDVIRQEWQRFRRERR